MHEDDRRKNTRVDFQATADIKFSATIYSKCETDNLSIKGVSILGITGHKIGEICEVFLALSGSTSELRLEMKAEVVRVDKAGIALHFTEVDLDSYYHLKNIIYYNSEDPDLIKTELSE